MTIRKASGFILFEILISLMILSIAIYGLQNSILIQNQIRNKLPKNEIVTVGTPTLTSNFGWKFGSGTAMIGDRTINYSFIKSLHSEGP